MPRPSATHDTPAGRTASPRVVFAVLAAATTAYSMMQSLVIPALPQIQREIGASPDATAWLITAFLLASVVATPTLGRLGDLLGLRRMLLIVLACLSAGTVLCAVSTSLPGLIAGRTLHGVGGAVFPLGFAIVRHQLPPKKVAGALGTLSALLGLGGALGVVLAGILTEHLSYQALFWLLLPCYLVVWAAAVWTIPRIPPQATGRVDLVGGVLLGVGLVVVLLAVTFANRWGWTSLRTLGCAAAGALVLVVWARDALRRDEPLIDVRSLGRRGLWTANAVAFLFGVGLYTAFALIPQYAQEPGPLGFGTSPLGATVYLLPWTALNMAVGVAAGRIERRVGARPLLTAGAVASATGFLLLVVARDDAIGVLVASGLVGFGIGAAFACLPTLVVQHVPPAETGEATGVNTVARMIGGALGGQVAAALLVGGGDGDPTRAGYAGAFAVGLVAMTAALALCALIPGRGRRSAVGVTGTGQAAPAD
ncbi:MFS transporter [Patulibacter minatonensis]|uniref:MFS transporter n=1 Tax=Patulibacter minatonensis TaxID=298163 RepID=UPI000683F792|nr:MFS transporter [Patulibacter minatonensis]